MARLPLLVVPALLALTHCDKPSEPERSGSPPLSSSPPSSPRPGPAGSSASAQPGAPADVAWDPPAGWTKAENPSPMRKATYRVPRAAGDAEDGELSVTQAGGTVDQNIARWAGQFDRKPGDVKRHERSAGGLKVTVVEIHGAYTGMTMPGAPPGVGGAGAKPGYALLGAIVETAPPTFFKLTGPEKTVTAAQRDFDKLVEGLRAK